MSWAREEEGVAFPAGWSQSGFDSASYPLNSQVKPGVKWTGQSCRRSACARRVCIVAWSRLVVRASTSASARERSSSSRAIHPCPCLPVAGTSPRTATATPRATIRDEPRGSKARRISRGNPPAGTTPLSAAAPSVSRLAATTVTLWAPEPDVPNRLELVTRMYAPPFTTATPTGAVPTGTDAMREPVVSPTSLRVSKARSALSPRALAARRRRSSTRRWRRLHETAGW